MGAAGWASVLNPVAKYAAGYGEGTVVKHGVTTRTNASVSVNAGLP